MVGPTTTRASNPRLMAQVLEAVKHLGEGRGSSAKEVLEILRRGKTARTRNLAMQVQRALKNAVNAGLLQLRSGRYKILFSLKRRKDSRENASLKPVEKIARKKEEIADLNPADLRPSETLDAGPRNRCSHCKKRKRRRSRSSGKRRRKGSSKRRRRRPTKPAARSVKDRKSRKLQRRGDEEVPGGGGRSRRRKISASEVPERTGKSVNPDRNEEEEEEGEEGTGEMDAADSRSRFSSPDAEGKTMRRGTKRRPAPGGARKKERRASSKRTRKGKSRKRSRSTYRVSSPAKDAGSTRNFQREEEEEHPQDLPMEFCDRDSAAST